MLCLYVFSVRILYEPILNINDLNTAEKILENNSVLMSEFFGEQSYSYTLHAQLHLAQQVRLHGPLHGHSQFVYEVINKIIKNL